MKIFWGQEGSIGTRAAEEQQRPVTWYLVCEIALTNAFKKHVTLYAKRILQFKQPSCGLHDTLSRLRVP